MGTYKPHTDHHTTLYTQHAHGTQTTHGTLPTHTTPRTTHAGVSAASKNLRRTARRASVGSQVGRRPRPPETGGALAHTHTHTHTLILAHSDSHTLTR